jgi:UPF0755 protein
VKKLLLFLLVVGVLLVGWAFYETQWPVRRESDPPQALVVEPGTGVREIGQRLHAMGYVRHPEIFRALVLWRGIASRVRAGEYELKGTMSLDDIVDKLARGDVVRRAVTFPEGSDIDDMAAAVAAKGLPVDEYRKAAADPTPIRDLDPEAPDLEGYLFPDTYDLTRRPDEARQLVARQVARFREVIQPELPKVQASGLTLREVLTLASLVELETARGEERPRVASVFLNRQKRRMPLQTHPTVIYALKKAGRWDGNIRKGDLDIDSAYNTYRRPGLPPGPIASPGRASIQAVLAPAPVQDLYFVSRNDGSPHFSATLAEPHRAVNEFQRQRRINPSALPGLLESPAAPASPAPSSTPAAPPAG